MRKFLQKHTCLVFVLAMLFAVAGCSGSDGAPGSQGPQGDPGPVTLTNESCSVCHGSSKIFDVDSTNASSVHYNAGQDTAFLTISNIQLTNVGGDGGATTYGTLDVSFHVANSSGAAVTNLAAAGTQIRIADLVPANTIPIQGTTENYQPRIFQGWAAQGDQSAAQHVVWTSYTNNGSGDYTVRLAPEHNPADMLLDEAAALQYVDLNAHIQRVAIMISGQPNTSISTLPAIGVGVKDFTGVPLNDGGNTSADATLQYQAAHVTVEACKKCHGETMQGTQHGNYWADTRVCAMCHNPFYFPGMAADKALIQQWIHEIHNGQIQGRNDFSEVVFPQPIDSCTVCHQDPDGLTTGSDANMDAWKTKPSATACSSCHETVNALNVAVLGVVSGVSTTLTAGQNHVGGAQPANSCSLCHGSAGTASSPTDIVTVHKLPEFVDGNDPTTAATSTVTAMNTPEFDATITVTEPNGSAPAGGYFVAGETPLVTVTLKNHSDGTDVASSVYTTLSTDASSTKGVAGGGLNNATVYVFGPRNIPGPVLTLNAAADRGESMRLPSGDPNVKTDSTGYKYLMQAIPSNMTAGTYIVTVQMNDYNAVSATDYVTTTVAKALFQVGTATVTPKASGDSCADCHGTTRMHLTGSHAHNVPFDTDFCNGCHDTTGLHGNPISNRVHAVHSANSDGDLGAHASYDWAEINFPQDVSNCKACHTSGGTGYLTNYEPVACFGCHGSTINNNAAWDHMLQNGAKTLDQNPNFK